MTRFTEEDLKKKGLVKNAKGIYEKMPRKPATTKAMVKKYLEGPSGFESHLTESQMTGYKKKLIFSWAGKSLSLNKWYSSKHWTIRNKQTKEWHQMFYAFIVNPKPFFKQYSIKMEHNSRLDNSNVIPMIKLAEDAIKKVGIITDDSTKYCKSITIEFAEEMRRGSFKLTFTEL